MQWGTLAMARVHAAVLWTTRKKKVAFGYLWQRRMAREGSAGAQRRDEALVKRNWTAPE